MGLASERLDRRHHARDAVLTTENGTEAAPVGLGLSEKELRGDEDDDG